VLDCGLPVELWITADEFPSGDIEILNILRNYNARLVSAPVGCSRSRLPSNSRWQWLLKPWSLLHSEFREVIYLDADSFPVRNPEYMFDHPVYKETGAVFWPDIGMTAKDNPIWEDMGVPYRLEPEFESGQMLIDTVRHREPLELALQMNIEAEKYYQMIWGDKDTFRFAFHKYGRPFAMIPHPLQLLSIPGRPHGDFGVMCQHDFEGNRLFQHRNLAKWDLLGHNPRIPGYLFEDESREYLAELRAMWNGRINWTPPRKNGHAADVWAERRGLVKDLLGGTWLAEDRRPRARGCCLPVQKWTPQRVSKPWGRELTMAEEEAQAAKGTVDTPSNVSNAPTISPEDTPMQKVPGLADDAGSEPASLLPEKPKATSVPMPPTWQVGLQCMELAFAADSTLSRGASPQAYWWDMAHEGGRWQLKLLNEKGVVANLQRRDSGEWWGTWAKAKGAKLVLRRVDRVYGEVQKKSGAAVSAALGKKNAARTAAPRSFHMANHAFGIGDAITGLYAAVGAAELGHKVVYHTRFPRWLERASHPNLTITDADPPKGTPDMDTDHAEQLRYARDKVRWYAGRVAGSLPVWNGARPRIDRTVRIPRVDFQRYVVISPFAAWESRDWPEMHWRRLAHLLRESGREMVVIGTAREEARIARTFDKSYAYWAIKRDDTWVEWVTDLMLGAEAVLGLDSGMIHMAGLLSVPAVSIHSHLPPEFLFSCAPSVRSAGAKTACTFCRWQEDRGFNEGCSVACSALATVGPERVMGELEAAVTMPGRRQGEQSSQKRG
jgi:hypothetical protein